MAAAPVPEDFVTVKTTLPVRPFPVNAERGTITTERLVLRALTAEDLHSTHVLRTQPEVMKYTSRGCVDRDLAETQTALDRYLAPVDVDCLNWAICLRESGELIGIGGNHLWVSSWGWPEVGYMIREEYWGKGLTTEFMRAFISAWDALPRAEQEIRVDARTADAVGADGRVEEQLIAVTETVNARSQAILRKSGFEHFVTWTETDRRVPEAPPTVELPTFRYFPARKRAA